jgi:hypothetical protein
MEAGRHPDATNAKARVHFQSGYKALAGNEEKVIKQIFNSRRRQDPLDFPASVRAWKGSPINFFIQFL